MNWPKEKQWRKSYGNENAGLAEKLYLVWVMKRFPFNFGLTAFAFALLISACKDKPIVVAKEECTKDFNVFFDRFGSEQSYQMEHIRFPLAFSFPSDDYDRTIDTLISRKDYRFIDFSQDKNALSNETDKFTASIDKRADKMIYFRQGYDNGILIAYEFAMIDGCWKLIKITDDST